MRREIPEAEAWLRDLGEYAEWRPEGVTATPLEMIEALRAGEGLSPEVRDGFLEDLEAVAALVDPDRVGSFDVYRALRALKAALASRADG
ncbi:MAG: hypothetical protein KF819_39350 [Labilithrix sp.]|nr:hypothetical protein [Labilithrix sp.]